MCGSTATHDDASMAASDVDMDGAHVLMPDDRPPVRSHAFAAAPTPVSAAIQAARVAATGHFGGEPHTSVLAYVRRLLYTDPVVSRVDENDDAMQLLIEMEDMLEKVHGTYGGNRHELTLKPVNHAESERLQKAVYDKARALGADLPAFEPQPSAEPVHDGKAIPTAAPDDGMSDAETEADDGERGPETGTLSQTRDEILRAAYGLAVAYFNGLNAAEVRKRVMLLAIATEPVLAMLPDDDPAKQLVPALKIMFNALFPFDSDDFLVYGEKPPPPEDLEAEIRGLYDLVKWVHRNYKGSNPASYSYLPNPPSKKKLTASWFGVGIGNTLPSEAAAAASGARSLVTGS